MLCGTTLVAKPPGLDRSMAGNGANRRGLREKAVQLRRSKVIRFLPPVRLSPNGGSLRGFREKTVLFIAFHPDVVYPLLPEMSRKM